jgi:cyanate permease
MAATGNNVVLVLGCVVFGLSAGNLLTLPALIIQREFEAASFGMLIGLSWAINQFTYSFGPGLLGIIRDATGSYTAPLLLCAALDVVAAAMVMLRLGKIT